MTLDCISTLLRTAAAPAAAAALSLALAGCGGGDQVARTGGGGTGIATTGGSVTGFGSILVDGTAWDDRNARIEVERAGANVPAEVRLGQRVEIEYATAGVAERVLVSAEVIGAISEIAAGTPPAQFKVAGQTVRVNTDPASGPVTLFDGVSSAAGLRVADLVEVHGAARFDSQLRRYVIVATRVERLAALPGGRVRVAGVVEDYVPAQQRLRLGELTVRLNSSTVVVPASRAIANGQRIVVWSDDPLGGTVAAPILAADQVRIVDRSANGAGNVRTDLAGVVSRLDPGALTFEILGLPVNARNAVIVPASQMIADGRYVIVRGTVDALGVLQATQVRLRANIGEAQVSLAGSITDFAGVADFRVRSVRVDASGVSPLSACPPGGLADGLFVEVEGSIDPVTSVIAASRVRCENNSAGRVQTFNGIASTVDLVTRSFTLTSANGTVRSAAWTATTYFDDVTPQTLANRSVRVDGYVQGSVLVVTKIRGR